MDQNIVRILLFLNDLLFYQAFGVNLSCKRCGMFDAGGYCTSIRYCTSVRTYVCATCAMELGSNSCHCKFCFQPFVIIC